MYSARTFTRPLRVVQMNATRRTIASTPRVRAVEDSPLSHSTPPRKGTSPWVLMTGLALLGGGAFYVYGAVESNRIDKEQKALEKRAASVGTMKEEAKGRVQDAARDARAGADQRAQGVRESAQAKWKDAREGAEGKWKDTKEGAEKTYEDGKKRVDGAVQDGRAAADKKADQAKQGWFSWLGWGKAKASDARDESQRLADDLKRRAGEAEDSFVKRFEEMKAKAQAKGEEVRQRAGETEEQYRIRLAKAISRKD